MSAINREPKFHRLPKHHLSRAAHQLVDGRFLLMHKSKRIQLQVGNALLNLD